MGLRARRPELVAAALALVWSLLPLGLLARRRDGDVLTGSDGALPGADQLSYLSFARESGAHGLFGDRFDLGAVERVGFQPMYLASGLLGKAGLDLRAALWLWKPVAAAVLVWGAAAYVRRFDLGRHGHWAALAIALAWFSPLLPTLDWAGALDRWQTFTGLLVSGELMPAWQLWGYLHAAISVGLMALALVALDRGRPGWAATAGCVATLLHPWKGLTLGLVLVAAAAWAALDHRRRGAPRPRLAATALPLAAIGLVLAYYLALSQLDVHWEIEGRQSETPRLGIGYLLMGLGPLAALAALGLPRPLRGFDRTLLLWPLAALVVYAVVANARYHAFQGMTIPLAVLAVRGWARLRLPTAAGAVALAAATLPGLAYQVDRLRDSVEVDRSAYFLRPDEARALDALEADPDPGGVLAPVSIGGSVPGHTGRGTWVGHFAWTPDYETRRSQTEALFGGTLAPEDARALVRATGARFLLAGCAHPTDLRPVLRPLRAGTRRFGCATVHELSG